MQWVVTLLVCSAVVGGSFCARILLVLPFPCRSHHIFSTAIMRSLADRGHELVEYSPFPPARPIPRHTHHRIDSRFERELGSWTYEDFSKVLSRHNRSIFGFKIRRIWEMNYEICEDTFKNEKIQILLKSNDSFDLVMTESTFGEESLLALGHRFSAPTVCIECFMPWSILNRDAGNALSIASVSDLTSAISENEMMSFKERLLNLISVSLSLFYYQFTHLPLQEEIVKKYMYRPDTPRLADMVTNVSLYVTNSHPSAVNYVHPYTPNILPIGGIHIVPHSSPLPQDIVEFMNGAKYGVIYFSLGTVVPLHVFPIETLQVFVNVFKRLSQRVLWKINLDSIPGLPQNVMIKKWMPQLGILEHENCRLFITHGGLFSHQEAIYAGVPTVGMPFFADQPYNLRYSEHRGQGIMINLFTLTEQTLYSALTTVLNNTRYQMNAARLSMIYRDRPVSARDSLVYWVEYVLRHQGAAHLRPASATLPWYQLTLLDVLAATLTIISLLIIVLYLVLKRMLSFISVACTHKTQSTKKKTN